MTALDDLESGQSKHLRGANLEDQTLSGLDLHDIDLAGAKLSGRI